MLTKVTMAVVIVMLAATCAFAGEDAAARSVAVGTAASVATQQSGTSTPSKKPSKKKQRKHKRSSGSNHKKPSNSK
jgi:curli biogenesis system outer membrane secretion channel CsgG